MISSHIVVDCSVVAKWFLPDEQDETALKIKEDFALSLISVSVPLLIFYEVNNLLKTAIKSVRINEDLAKKAYEGFFDLDFAVYSTRELMNLTLEKALRFDISSYDASYIALADYLQIPFYSADKKLIKKASGTFVLPLELYSR